ncbi:MBL fold metallo-hydrolase [Rariglobus hedericola]|uniref:MBL fold metallo-hydrolase n=1 Tax=Rariglobus hedericola TaxID=2597822 RepID=A0A556QNM9_9BACT|nr:MBL fold metallo-hydrolase [Rariglobus hedericola]TSJ78250.1 MBL fold metallo-hydrolase [Rariglobus hedericola]
MKLIDLNPQGGIGANSIYLQIGDVNILIDSGLNPKQAGRLAMPDFSLIKDISLDLIIITHCHLDHIGSLPVIMRQHPNAKVVMTHSSKMILDRMLHNSANVMLRQKEENNIPDYPLFTHEEVDRCVPRFTGMEFLQPQKFKGKTDEVEIMMHHAGHVAGACAVELHHKDRHIFVTGDVLFENQRTLRGAQFPSGHFDTVIMETTRGTTERQVGKERVNEVSRLIASINDTINRGGSFLLPVFALGRMQEILSIIHDARKFGRLVKCPIYAAGMGMALADYFDEISRKYQHVQFNRNIIKELNIQPTARKLDAGKDLKQNALYIISSGMLVERTPSYTLASGLIGSDKNTIGFVGYCDPDTPGGQLLQAKQGEDFTFATANVTTKLQARVERFELSGHADREELAEFAIQTQARSVVLTHGDQAARDWFTKELESKMPGSKIIDPVPLKTYEL